ncbi:MAG: hypothetical protein ABII12_12455 [Planctomycetota bacterium]
MSAWWAKFVASLRGEEPEVTDSSTPTDVAGGQSEPVATHACADHPAPSANEDIVAEQAFPDPGTDPRDVDTCRSSKPTDPSAGLDDTRVGLSTKVDELNAFLHRVHEILSEIARETYATAAEAARRQEAATALEGKIDAVSEQTLGLRETSDKLLEIVTAQVEAISNIEQRISVFDDRTAATADEVSRTARELDGLKSHLAQLSQAVAQLGEVCSDLADRQQQMAESVGSLEQRVSASCEAAKSASAAIQHVADDRVARHEALREHVTEQSKRLATRGTLALVLSGIAAVAAIVAAVLAYLR